MCEGLRSAETAPFHLTAILLLFVFAIPLKKIKKYYNMICQGKQHPLEDVEHFLSDLVTNFQ